MSMKQITYKVNIKSMVILITAYFTADHVLLTFFKHARSYFWFNLDSKTLFYKDCSLVCNNQSLITSGESQLKTKMSKASFIYINAA